LPLTTDYANEMYLGANAEIEASGGNKENGGIANPKPVKLSAGQYYYRFVSSKVGDSLRRKQGCWWIEFEQFNTIRRYANEATKYCTPDSKRMAIRYSLALPYSWTECDLLLRGYLRRPLHAFRGLGRRARGVSKGGDTQIITPPVTMQIYQLYIPGLQFLLPDTIWQDLTEEYLFASPHFKVRGA
jgi:hypothetical protein